MVNPTSNNANTFTTSIRPDALNLTFLHGDFSAVELTKIRSVCTFWRNLIDEILNQNQQNNKYWVKDYCPFFKNEGSLKSYEAGFFAKMVRQAYEKRKTSQSKPIPLENSSFNASKISEHIRGVSLFSFSFRDEQNYDTKIATKYMQGLTEVAKNLLCQYIKTQIPIYKDEQEEICLHDFIFSKNITNEARALCLNLVRSDFIAQKESLQNGQAGKRKHEPKPDLLKQPPLLELAKQTSDFGSVPSAKKEKTMQTLEDDLIELSDLHDEETENS